MTTINVNVEGRTISRDRPAVAEVNVDLCVNCGICRRYCPMEAISEYQKDICRACPDCAPGKPVFLDDDSKAYAPKHACSLACPLGTIPEGYVNLIAEGKLDRAYDLVTELNPLPILCAMVCNHPCEDDCKRGLLRDEPIAIRALKRYVLENVAPKPLKYNRQHEKKIAIIGAGPAGLTAASDLAKKGYIVKIFESKAEAGGMARHAIPDFRIDKDKMDEEIQRIIDAGVEIEYNARIGNNFSELSDGYDAILIAAGAAKGAVLLIPGANCYNVYTAVDLMLHVNGKQHIELGKKAVVIGGGSVAMDAARTLKRLGLDVTCACLESGGEVPAPAWEIEEAREEGVELIEGVSPQSINADLFNMMGVTFKKVTGIETAENGGLKPVFDDNSAFTIDCDTVIFAVGQKPLINTIISAAKLETLPNGRLKIDDDTLVTSVPNIFVAGDTIEARGSVISAMASGRKAALSIDNYLQERVLRDRAADEQEPKLGDIRYKIYPATMLERLDPEPVPKLRSRDTFEQVEGVFDDEAAAREARRCMKCGYSGVDPEQCIGCGVCVEMCPEQAITLKKI